MFHTHVHHSGSDKGEHDCLSLPKLALILDFSYKMTQAAARILHIPQLVVFLCYVHVSQSLNRAVLPASSEWGSKMETQAGSLGYTGAAAYHWRI